MSEIRVWPGINIEGEQGKVTLSLIRMKDEPEAVYLKRCQEVVNLALSYVPKSEPEIWNFDDTSRFHKVGEGCYEMVTPGYQSQEEQPNS